MASFRASAKKGVADVLACFRGQLVAVEIKIGKDRLSDEQQGFMKNVSFHGGKVFVATDFASFKEWWDHELSTSSTGLSTERA